MDIDDLFLFALFLPLLFINCLSIFIFFFLFTITETKQNNLEAAVRDQKRATALLGKSIM